MSVSSLNILRIPLDTAGLYTIQQGFGYVHVFRFEDANGVEKLDGKIEVSFSVSEDDFIPMQYNNRVAWKADRGRIRWAAQPNTVVIVGIASDAREFAADTPNPKQLVVSSGGTSFAAAAVSVLATATLLSASNPLRQSVTFKNRGALPVYLGAAGVTVAQGYELNPGESATFDKTTAAIYAIASVAGQDVRVVTEA